MIRLVHRLVVAWILAFGAIATEPAAAQYDGPGLQACQAYAAQRIVRHSAISLLVDRNTRIERYRAKVGSQFVSSVLTGNAVFRFTVPGNGEVFYRQQRYLCLLADERTPVFFHATEEK